MAELTVTKVSEAGSNVSYTAASAGGDTAFNGGGNTMLNISNGSGASVTVTVASQVANVDDPQFGDLTKDDATCTVPAGETQPFGPFAPSAFNDSNGDINISYSATTSVEIAAFKPEDLNR